MHSGRRPGGREWEEPKEAPSGKGGGMKDGGMYLLSAEGGAKLEMWHDPPPPGTESISLPGGAAKGAGLGDGGGGGDAGR